MYVCICNAITESELRRAARGCAGDVQTCYSKLGKQPNCGHCLDEAEDILSEERGFGVAGVIAA